MGKILPKFLTSLRRALIFLVFFIVTSSVALNTVFNIKKDKITELLSSPLTYQTSTNSIFYIFPNTLLFRDLKLTPKGTAINTDTAMSLPLVAIQFSIWNAIHQKPISLSTIILNKPSSSQSALVKFLSENAQSIISFIQRLPPSDVTILIKEAQVHPVSDAPEINSLITNFSFTIKGKKFTGHGNISHIQNQHPLFINFSGDMLKTGLRLTNLNIDKTNLSSSFWGEAKGSTLNLKGYAFYSDQISPQSQKNPGIPFTVKSRRVPNPTAEIVDLDARITLGFPKIELEQVSFNLNNFPVTANGALSLMSPITFKLTASVLNAPPGTDRIKNFKKADFGMNGKLLENVFKAQTNLGIAFDKGPDDGFPLETISIASDLLQLYFDPQRRFVAQLDQSTILTKTTEQQYKLSFDTLRAFFNFKGEKFKIIDLLATLYGGQLQGRIWSDTTQWPMRLIAHASFSGITARSFSEFLEYFTKIEGKLSGKIKLQSNPIFDLTGNAVINDGALHNLDFFKWMAETFNMPSLIDIPFSETKTDFWLNAQGSGIKNISIISENVGLGGYYSVNASKLVSSKLSLSLSRRTLQESPKFRAILKMFDQEVPNLDFDFQLSGKQDAMNFQWLQSDFKEHIQSRIPNFVERTIDRKIDDILQGNIPDEPSNSPQ